MVEQDAPAGARLRRGIWPLPGAADCWSATLVDLVSLATDEPSTEEYLDRMTKLCPTVGSTAFRYLAVMKVTGFLVQARGRVVPSRYGQELLKGRRSREAVIASALLDRVAAIREILALLDKEPRRSGLIHAEISRDFGWTSPNQVQFRLKWLETADLIERRKGRYPVYGLTPRGKRCLNRASAASGMVS